MLVSKGIIETVTRADTLQRRYRQIFILFLMVATAAALLAVVRGFILAMLMAVIFSALLHPFYLRVLRRLGGRRTLASACVLAISIVAIGLPLLALLGLVAGEALKISETVAPWIEKQADNPVDLSIALPAWVPYADQLEPYKSQIMGKLSELAGATGDYLFNSISAVTRGTVGIVLNLFVFAYAMFYFLMQGPALLDRVLRYFPLEQDDRTRLVEKGLSVTKATLKGILVIGALQGVLVALAFWVVGIPGAAFWGTVVLVLSAIPALGTPLIWGPAAVYLLATGQTVSGVALIVWGVLLVGLVDNILRPRLVGEATRLPDLLILVSTLGGIAAFGTVGIIVGPILTALFITALDIYAVAFREELPDPPAEQLSAARADD